jgi:hypothetical protein
VLKVWDEAKPDTKKGNTRLFGPPHRATTERQKKKNQRKKRLDGVNGAPKRQELQVATVISKVGEKAGAIV